MGATMAVSPTKLSSRVPRGSPRTLWPSHQKAADLFFAGKPMDEADMRPSELMALWDEQEAIRSQRGRLHDMLVLPEHDAAYTGAGHAPAGPYGDYGPPQPKRGQRMGDTLGATHSVLNVQTCAK